MKSATVSATVSVIALGAAVFLSPAQADTYELTTIIQVPPSTLNQQGDKFVNFDISFFDPSTQLDYVADRSNAAVDIFSAATNTFVGHTFGNPNFAGQVFTGGVANNSVSGPDGVQVINIPASSMLPGAGQHQVFAGDGPSTVYNFSISNQTTNPTVTQVGLPSANGNPLNTGSTSTPPTRADEMAYAPTTNTLLVANNADTPAFATLINAKTGAIIAGHITVPQGGLNGGLEASDFNPVTKTFFISVPALDPTLANNPNAKGGVAQINPATGAIIPINGQPVLDLQKLGAGVCGNCSPTGLAAAANGQMLIGDGNTGPGSGAIIIDSTGKLVATFPGIQGVDQVWYDPTTNRWFLAAGNNPASNGGPELAIIDAATDSIFQILQTTPGDHSVAVDPITKEIFVPFAANPGNMVFGCQNGCIGVFSDVAAAVPEPSTWAMMLIGFLGLGFAFRQSRRKVSFA
jgi:PEP-CTERM motif